MTDPDWARLYAETHERVGVVAPEARLTLCGFSACVDVNLSLEVALPELRRAAVPAALALADELERRAAAGIGGEIVIDWPALIRFFQSNATTRVPCGFSSNGARRTFNFV